MKIEYRPGGTGDLPQITQMLADSEHHGIVDAATVGGLWYVATRGEEVIGCMWCFTDGYNAYWDYLYIKPAWRNGRIALRMGAGFEAWLKHAGVRRVLSTMHSSNTNVIRMAVVTGHAVDSGYELGYKELS